MSPHLAGERALLTACATLVASKCMKERFNGWKASCMLKQPDWWLAITHLPLFIRPNVLAIQTACLGCPLAANNQVYLSNFYSKRLIERGEVNILQHLRRLLIRVFLIYIAHSHIKSLTLFPVITFLS